MLEALLQRTHSFARTEGQMACRISFFVGRMEYGRCFEDGGLLVSVWLLIE